MCAKKEMRKFCGDVCTRIISSNVTTDLRPAQSCRTVFTQAVRERYNVVPNDLLTHWEQGCPLPLTVQI
jgi:hypothetical protein